MPTSASMPGRRTRGGGSTRCSRSTECSELLPETAGLPIERYRFPNIFSLNFVIVGLLEEGVAASTRQDAQAKALGEWLRARVVELPISLLPSQLGSDPN